MSRLLSSLPTGALSVLADALEGGRLGAPFLASTIQRFLGGVDCAPIAAALSRLAGDGFNGRQIAVILRALKGEREETQKARDEIELAWTGPEVPGSASRDTSVVMRELFLEARSQILLSTYALARTKALFAPLAERMDQEPDLHVRLFAHVSRISRQANKESTTQALKAPSESESLRRFADHFRAEHWPGARTPEVFYDPRTLLPRDENGTISLHAKCVVVDEKTAFVTSANFTEAAQQRNIEAGVIVRNAGFAKALVTQFERLVSAGKLVRVPGLG